MANQLMFNVFTGNFDYVGAPAYGGVPTQVPANTTHTVPANIQEVAMLDCRVDGDITFVGDWVFLR